MPLIGVRKLREEMSQVLRRVCEEGEKYIITHRGRPVAILLPLDMERLEEAVVAIGREQALGWDEYERLAEEVRRRWPEGLGTQEVMDAIRR